MIQERLRRYLSPVRVAAGYFVFGIVWIPSTDMLLAYIFESQQFPSLVGMAKGWVFIGLSTGLIFVLLQVHQQNIQQTQYRLENANQQLQVLHRVLRHNIRNDLTKVRGYTGLVVERTSDPQTTSYLQIVEDTTEDLIRVSEKLKIVDKVDPTRSTSVAVELTDLVTAELDRLRVTHPELTITTDFPDHTWVEGTEALRFAVREVLENSVTHFDGPASECVISLAIECDNTEVVLEIADNGGGIPKEELLPLRTEKETPLVHASSVGLWLITWLCRIHNGSAEFESENGTAVSLQLQRASQEALLETEASLRSTLEKWK